MNNKKIPLFNLEATKCLTEICKELKVRKSKYISDLILSYYNDKKNFDIVYHQDEKCSFEFVLDTAEQVRAGRALMIDNYCFDISIIVSSLIIDDYHNRHIEG